MKYLNIKKIITFLILCLLGVNIVYADTVDEINKQIETNKNKIQQLDAEIQKTATDLNKTSQEKTTLQSTINTLDTTKKKLDTNIKVTQVNISTTNLNLNKLAISIDEKNQQINDLNTSISKSMRTLYEADSQSLIEILLTTKNISDVWNHTQALISLNSALKEKIQELQGLTKALANDKSDTEQKKNELEQQQKTLSLQKQSVESTVAEKAQILKETKNKEANFKKLLADKQAQKTAFENELFNFEQQLKIKIDPNSYPQGQTGILSWPLAKHVITQLFGSTVDSKRLYTSGTHNGVDFGTPVGTPIKAALSGTVIGTGNTDAQPGCYSFGKWVMISHSNGLSTMYGHFSSILVKQGDVVKTGDLIGLSGNTGYSTGPHLHFGVYATQGTRIERYVNSNFCKNVTIPIADTKAYLDPMVYLPH